MNKSKELRSRWHRTPAASPASLCVIAVMALGSLLCAQAPPGPRSGDSTEAPGQPVTSRSVPTTSATNNTRGGYLIGPGDILAINVWKDAELSKTMPVRPDGKISLPLTGEVQASGLTAAKLEDAITIKLRDYITNPEVNVIVQEIKSRTFNVVGKVAKPGSYDLSKPTTVLDAVALAGGFQDFAKVTKVYVLRRGADGSQRMLPFNYKQVIKGQALNQNVDLQPGDTVVAP